MRRNFLKTAASLAALALLSLGANADTWPSKSIEFVVGYAAGGPTDVTARVLAQELSRTLGQSVVVTNKLGAASLVATQQFLRVADLDVCNAWRNQVADIALVRFAVGVNRHFQTAACRTGRNHGEQPKVMKIQRVDTVHCFE